MIYIKCNPKRSSAVTSFLIEYYGGIINNVNDNEVTFRCDSLTMAREITKSISKD